MAQTTCRLRVHIPFWCFPACRALIFVMSPILVLASDEQLDRFRNALAGWIASRVRVVAE